MSQSVVRSINDTKVEMTELVDSSMTDGDEHLLPSHILKWMDISACMSAEKFCQRSCVTAAMDTVRFIEPTHTGDVVIVKSQVNRAFRTSMEVGCKVFKEDLIKGVLKHTCSAYFTFVSLGDNGKPVPLPKLNANRAQPISGDGNGDNTETGGEKKENHDGVGSGGEGDSGDCTNSAGESGEMSEEEKEKEASIYMENQRRFTEALERRTIRLNRKRIIDNVQSLTAKEEQKRRLEELERKQTVEEKEVKKAENSILAKIFRRIYALTHKKHAHSRTTDDNSKGTGIAVADTARRKGDDSNACSSGRADKRAPTSDAAAAADNEHDELDTEQKLAGIGYERKPSFLSSSSSPCKSPSPLPSSPAPSPSLSLDTTPALNHQVTVTAVDPASFPVKGVAASITNKTEMILPEHANHMRTAFGGQSMAWMATAGQISATRFARKKMVLRVIDDIHFFCPILVGDRVNIESQVNRVFNQSMEVGVRLYKLELSGKITHALTAHMTFTTWDRASVPFKLKPRTEEEKHRFAKALGRRRVRLLRRTIGTHGESLSFPWSKSRALDLIYSNIRGLLMVNNSNVVKQSLWETMRTSRIKRGKTTLDFKLSTQLNVNGLTCVRIQCVVPLSRDRLTEVLLDLNSRHKWDDMYLGGKCLEEVNKSNDIWLMKWKHKKLPLPQDMVILRSWRVDEEETVISLRSVLHPHAPPTPTQYIRSEILSSGYIIRDVSPANSIPTPKAKSLFSRSSSSPSSPSSHFSYIVQLGPKALKLFVDYMTGDAENSLDHTLAKLFSVAE